MQLSYTFLKKDTGCTIFFKLVCVVPHTELNICLLLWYARTYIQNVKQQVGKATINTQKKKETECRQVSLEKHFRKGVSKCLDVDTSGCGIIPVK